MNKRLDNLKYQLIDIKINIDEKLGELEKLTQKLDKIWLEIDDINK